MISLDGLGRELHRSEGEEPLIRSTTSAELGGLGLGDLEVQPAVSFDTRPFAVRDKVDRWSSLFHEDALDESVGRNLAIYGGTLRPSVGSRVRLGDCAESVEGISELLIHRSLLIGVEDGADFRVVLLSSSALLVRLDSTSALDSLSLLKAPLARV